MKILLIVLLFIHGLIHFMGFAKAFDYGNSISFTKEISKTTGILWLLVGLLFIISAILSVTKKDFWSILVIIAVVFSQILIFMFWKDTKFGTITNIIILLIGISAFGEYQFNTMIQKESRELLKQIKVEKTHVISENEISHLPEIIQKWMRNSGVIGKEKIVSVRLKQIGEMKTKPKNKWMSFIAIQYFNTENPAFVWSTKVNFMPLVNLVGRDKMIDGKGEMLIKLANVIPVVNESNNEKINSGTLIRYMAEMVWFPNVGLNDYMNWESIDANKAKATFTLNGKSVSGIYTFSDEGNFKSFETDRYYGGRNDSNLEKWEVIALDYKEFNGVNIPNKCKINWKLKEGDFNWLNLEITEMEFNKVVLFNN